MKIFLGIIFLSLLILTSPVKSSGIGQGELKLSQQMVDWFIKYVKLSGGKKPRVFLVTTDGVTGITYSVRTSKRSKLLTQTPPFKQIASLCLILRHSTSETMQ